MKKQSPHLAAIYGQLRMILRLFRWVNIVGAMWGDEGKGKIVDLFMRFFDIAVRFSGGANAGHTTCVRLKKLISHLIPCGLGRGKTCVLARGEFFDSGRFIAERADAKKVLGRKLAPILIDFQCPLWTPWHPLYESYLESKRGGEVIGTTGRAIGPLSAFNALRNGLHVGELFAGERRLLAHLTMLYNAISPCLDEMVKAGRIKPSAVPTPEQVTVELLRHAEEIKPAVKDTSFFLSNALRKGKRILFEGAQALGLDLLWGTYPYVSAGMSAAAGAAYGTGLPLKEFANGAVVLVTKLFPTRVGEGPFPSELWNRKDAELFPRNRPDLFNEGSIRKFFLADMRRSINLRFGKIMLAQYLQVLGNEYGATTGRGRSVGMLDIPWLLYSIRVNGPLFLALTRLDMASGLRKIPVVIGYMYKGKRLAKGRIPEPWNLHKVKPIIHWLRGWEENISGYQREEDLPENARTFLNWLENAIGLPILLVGTGAERDAILLRNSAVKKLVGAV